MILVRRVVFFRDTSLSRLVTFSSILTAVIFSSNSQANESDQRFLNKSVSINCRGITDLDFAFEMGAMLSDWCKKQNEILGEQGCGRGSEMCLEEFILADRPGNTLYFGLGASFVHADQHSNGNDFHVDEPFWSANQFVFPKDGNHSFSIDSTYDRLQLMFSVGVEFPLGSRRTVRKKCVNPYSSPYVSMMANQVLASNQAIQSFLRSCTF